MDDTSPHAPHQPTRDKAQEAKLLERLQLLRPIDDEFMRCIFRGQLPLAQKTLRTITGIKDLVLTEEVTQYDLKRLAGARSICLDVLGTDDKGAKYDLEVQRADEGAHPKRARYHSSALDVETLKANQDFEALPESYVIFVTENDVMGKGEPLYHFRRIDPHVGIELQDSSHIIYANASYEGTDELGMLMHDFLCSNPDDMLTPELAARARELKTTKGVREMSSVMDEWKAEIREEVRQEVRQEVQREVRQEVRQEVQREVRQEVRQEVQRESFLGIIKRLGVSVEAALDALSVPPEQRDEYRRLAQTQGAV